MFLEKKVTSVQFMQKDIYFHTFPNQTHLKKSGKIIYAVLEDKTEKIIGYDLYDVYEDFNISLDSLNLLEYLPSVKSDKIILNDKIFRTERPGAVAPIDKQNLSKYKTILVNSELCIYVHESVDVNRLEIKPCSVPLAWAARDLGVYYKTPIDNNLYWTKNYFAKISFDTEDREEQLLLDENFKSGKYKAFVIVKHEVARVESTEIDENGLEAKKYKEIDVLLKMYGVENLTDNLSDPNYLAFDNPVIDPDCFICNLEPMNLFLFERDYFYEVKVKDGYYELYQIKPISVNNK